MLSIHSKNKYWLLPNLIGVEKYPCDLENCIFLSGSSYLAIQIPVHETFFLDLFEVKEFGFDDLEEDTQAEDGEAEGGHQEEDGIRTGPKKLIGIIPDENNEWNLATGIYKASSKSAYICPAQPPWTSTARYATSIGPRPQP